DRPLRGRARPRRRPLEVQAPDRALRPPVPAARGVGTVGNHVFLVLSEPPAGLAPEEYERWYGAHVREGLDVPGFVGAARYALRFVRSSSGDRVPFSYLTRYEIAGDFDAAMAALRAAVDGGRMSFPDWYPGVSSVGFEAFTR